MIISIIALIISFGAISISIVDAVVCIRCMDEAVKNIDFMIKFLEREEDI